MYLAPKPSNLTIIQQNSVVATNQITISKYANYPTTTQRKILPTDWNPLSAGQCVGFVKYLTGVDYSGNAISWQKYINTQIPEIDSIVVINAGKSGHVGIVIDKDENTITVLSRNWNGLWVISKDKFNINDNRILGFITYK